MIYTDDEMGKNNIHMILVFVSLALFIAGMCIMRYHANNIINDNNERILDLRMGYSSDDIIHYINGLDNNSKDYYVFPSKSNLSGKYRFDEMKFFWYIFEQPAF